MQEKTVQSIDEDEIDLRKYILILWNMKSLIFIVMLLSLIVSVVIAKRLPPKYTSVSKWLPSQINNSTSSGLSGLAALTGMNLGATSDNYEIFYDEILVSPIFLDSLITKSWLTMVGDSLTLFEILNIDVDKISPPERYLTKDIILKNMLYGYLTSIVTFKKSSTARTLSVSTSDPVLSYEVNKQFLELLKKYTESEKNSNAKKERLFIEERYNGFRGDLKKAEAQLKRFRENNMNVNSPSLMLAQQRLIREVEVFNQLVIEFRKQLELAKIEEVKKIPEFNILQEPTIPITKSKSKKKIIILIGTVLGLILGCFVVLVIHWTRENVKKFKEQLSS
ncbi:MAG: Wzz/FepE/Etk N-terminal domain-containing protein [Fibrobacterales bacterium]